jgi:hypothetical protein
MYVSESTFVHLRQAEDERRSQELEYRRIARERKSESESESTTGGGLRELIHRIRRSAQSRQRRLSHP